jgi:hypothetical protein
VGTGKRVSEETGAMFETTALYWRRNNTRIGSCKSSKKQVAEEVMGRRRSQRKVNGLMRTVKGKMQHI